ncbi:peroxidase 21 [Corylus avellana]|uniref:peroxidase 21 n=1 Tax=Corylus avellana TaxID=13451 RepID=UPI001E1F4E3D|nr:peroxidase 21 [Corylus avellana]
MATTNCSPPFLFLLFLPLLFQFNLGKGDDLQLNYYSQSCPNAEEIIKQEVTKLYDKHGNTAVSWIRNLFHDCMVKLTETQSIQIEINNQFRIWDPILNQGAHSVGRVHCINLVDRLYPTVDPTLDPNYADYLKGRCPTPNPDPQGVFYARNDRETPMILDNMYYKNLLGHKGLLTVDQQLVSDPTTNPYVENFATDNGYFHDQFARAVLLLSENNPLTGDQGEIRKDCRYVNRN